MDTQTSFPDPPRTVDPAIRVRGARWLRIVLIALAVLVVGYLAATLALSRFLDPARLADWIEPRLEAVLNREIDIDRAEVGLFPLSLQLRDVEVSDPTGLAPALARVGSIELRVAMLPLIRRQVRVDRIALDAPEADLRIDADGRSNFGDLSPAARESTVGEEDRPFGLDLRGIRAEGGRVHYSNQTDSVTILASDLEATAAVRRDAEGTWTFVGSSGGDLTVERAGGASFVDGVPLDLSFDVLAAPEFQEIEIRTGGLALGPITLGLAGRVDRLKEPVRQVSLDLAARELPLEDILRLLPDSVRDRFGDAVGMLAADLHVEGELGPERRPRVEGRVFFAADRVTASDGEELAVEVAGEVILAEDGFLRPEVEGIVLGGPASVGGVVTLGSDGRVDLLVRGSPDLGRVGSMSRVATCV
jgi:hypothetical protein